ncbi:hypothetical protein HA402_011281 [Bradysia odoriphaga]|nr:hypothetical protein HA402_011281 [Bradysia odoriphaga]
MADPVIKFNYMSHEEDWIKFRHCVRLTREIFGQKAFDEFRGPEIQPGEKVETDDQIDAFLREHLESAYHPSGHLPHGGCERSHGGGRSGNPRHRRRWPARGGQLDLPACDLWQPQRPIDHDRREGGRPHPGQATTRPLQPGAVGQSARRRERSLERRVLSHFWTQKPLLCLLEML